MVIAILTDRYTLYKLLFLLDTVKYEQFINEMFKVKHHLNIKEKKTKKNVLFRIMNKVLK